MCELCVKDRFFIHAMRKVLQHITVLVLGFFGTQDNKHIYSTCRGNENILRNASLRESPSYIYGHVA